MSVKKAMSRTRQYLQQIIRCSQIIHAVKFYGRLLSEHTS